MKQLRLKSSEEKAPLTRQSIYTAIIKKRDGKKIKKAEKPKYYAMDWADAKAAVLAKKGRVILEPSMERFKLHHDGDYYWDVAYDGTVMYADVLAVSVSGGRTSGYMAYLLKQKYGHLPMVFNFANTGWEHEKTLEFVDFCDKEFNLNLNWLEAVFVDYDKPLSYKMVDYKSASRKGEPFEAMVKRFGLPNQSFKHCSRETKRYVMARFLRATGKRLRHMSAIGIRADEWSRIAEDQGTAICCYPLIDENIVKADVFEFWSRQKYDLEIETAFGNCLGCHKKSENKLRYVASVMPEAFDVALMLQEKYETYIPKKQEPRRSEHNFMYRGYRHPQWFLDNPIEIPATDDREIWLESLYGDESGCESCEAY